MLRQLFYYLPPSLRFTARRLFFSPIDMFESISGKRDELTPPRGLIYTGSGDFKAQGERMRQFFIEKGELKPNARVLDVGSGIGRMAVPLTAYLSEEGSYEGFDAVELGVRWCQNHISKQFPNFNFRYVPLNNDLYRSDGIDAADYKFPYEDARFNFTILISVFTHMLPEQVENYLQEIARTLEDGGTCIATFFLLNEESKKLMPSNPAFAFPYDYGHYRLMDKQVKSANVAFAESYIENLVQSAGLSIAKCFYGYWCGRPKPQCEDFQDVLILKK